MSVAGHGFGQGIKWTFEQLKAIFRVSQIKLIDLGLTPELGKTLDQN